MSRSLIAAPSLALVAALALGCETGAGPHLPVYLSDDNQVLQEPTGDGLVARGQPPIPDVPLPIGFVMITGQSRSYALPSGGRFVQHVYQGRAARGDVMDFYRREPPRAGWRPHGEQTVAGDTTMNFTKGAERLEVRTTYPRGVATVRATVEPIGAPGGTAR